MRGRYGSDSLNSFLLILAIIFMVISWIKPKGIWSLLIWIILIYALYRTFSRNISQRAAENAKFLNLGGSIRHFFRKWKRRIFGEDGYAYFPCDRCKRELRVPKGKGKIKVRCPYCNNKMTKRT